MSNHLTPPAKVYLGDSTIHDAGRGMFASSSITKGEVIEICPVLHLPEEDYVHLKKTGLRNYYFLWTSKDHAVVCLGYGSLYNHSYEPNATYQKNLDDMTITFTAIKPIKKDEEITVNYNYGNPDDKSKLWIAGIPEATD